MEEPLLKMLPLDSFVFKGKIVLFRPDINSPIDPETGRIVNANRIEKTVPTLRYLLEHGAKVAMIAHQGDTLDYQNLIPMAEHAERLAELTGSTIGYLDDVCGPAAIDAVRKLGEGECVLLGNLRYLTEEVSTFEDAVKLTPEEMQESFLLRTLAPLADYYVNDAFAAAHRNAPSMVAFQERLPSIAGFQLMAEYAALKSIMEAPKRPCVFLLGGAKISDAFGMMEKVLDDGAADRILTTGVTGLVMLIAGGKDLGRATQKFLHDRSLHLFIPEAEKLLTQHREKIILPCDLAYDRKGERSEIDVDHVLSDDLGNSLFPDIGRKSVALFREHILLAGSVFVNGPAGVYEDPRWEYGTRELWRAIEETEAYTVIGGGDTINAAARFADLSRFGYVCTGGGALVRFLSGKRLPLIVSMERAYERDRKTYVRK